MIPRWHTMASVKYLAALGAVCYTVVFNAQTFKQAIQVYRLALSRVEIVAGEHLHTVQADCADTVTVSVQTQ